MITFSDAKNGEKTCAADGKHIHSAYNPSREAENFVQRMEAAFNPSAVFIIEPALSYCLPFLRKRFSQAIFCAIRLVKDFAQSDRLWDICIYAEKENDLTERLYASFGEEVLCSSLFFAWPGSETAFASETKNVWQAIKNAVSKSRDVLGTRSYFAKRWLKNSIRFCSYIKRPALIEKGSCDILIAASGPSLKDSLPHIKEFRERFYLIALSSALLPLLSYGISPDLVISTDGGYWAKKHLALCGMQSDGIPHAIAAEAALPLSLLEKAPLIPLCYEDGLENKMLAACGLSAMIARRNGTVSGTALELALNLTDRQIFFCGLDLEKSQSFQHTEPNALSLCNEIKDGRLRPKESRIAASVCSPSGALDIYRAWFRAESERLGKRMFRLSDNYSFKNSLGAIKDINWAAFEKKCPACAGKKPALNFCGKNDSSYDGKIRSVIKDFTKSEEFYRELFPVETMLKNRSLRKEEKSLYEKKIAEKSEEVLRELERLIHE